MSNNHKLLLATSLLMPTLVFILIAAPQSPGLFSFIIQQGLDFIFFSYLLVTDVVLQTAQRLKVILPTLQSKF